MSSKNTNDTGNKKEPFFKKWAPVFVLSLALAIILIDATLLNVSLATLVKDFNTDIQSLQWVITAYSLTIAALTITGGRLGDLFGRKKMFVIGAALFAAGSFIASISQDVGTMILGESIIEGIGAALMMPATSSLLVSKYRGKDRSIAFGIWGGVAAASTAIGPLLGGFLTTYYSWRWGFRINVVIAALLILGSFIIKDYREKEEKPQLDFVGVILSALGMFMAIYGIIESSTYGWWTAKSAWSIFGKNIDLWGNLSITPYALALGILTLIGFLFWEKRIEKTGRTPLVSLHLFSNRPYISGVTTSSIFALGQAGLIFSIPVFLQSVRGASAFDTGLAMLPMSITALIMAPVGGILSHKVSPKRLVQVGLAAFVSAYAIVYLSLNVDTTVADLTWPFIIMGFGMGTMMASISNLTLSAVSHEQAGEASGVNNTLRQVGSTLGTAIIGAVMLTAVSTNLVNGISNSTVIPDKLKQTVITEISKQSSNIEFGGGAQVPATIPAAIKSEINKVGYESIADANKEALGYAIIFGIAGLISTLWLPSGTNVEFEKSLASQKTSKGNK
ncbi:MFS transporter [Candidatus Saccharibacteria bacterium]|nr:MFS transporter [Candidatus Saccharibacteria bacterium]